MPRSHRPRRRTGQENAAPLDLGRALSAVRRVEAKRDGRWNVQPQSAAAAVKVYLCPGCGREIEENISHLVTWRADGILGEAEDLAARRHWHSTCWRIRP